MSASTSGFATPADEAAGPGLKKLKILMLHGVYYLCGYYFLHLAYERDMSKPKGFFDQSCRRDSNSKLQLFSLDSIS
jgi:hypothetical protein